MISCGIGQAIAYIQSLIVHNFAGDHEEIADRKEKCIEQLASELQSSFVTESKWESPHIVHFYIQTSTVVNTDANHTGKGAERSCGHFFLLRWYPGDEEIDLYDSVKGDNREIYFRVLEECLVSALQSLKKMRVKDLPNSSKIVYKNGPEYEAGIWQLDA
eukprot:Nk52_evm1s1347 gene=Nk52_evmTU1s1347